MKSEKGTHSVCNLSFVLYCCRIMVMNKVHGKKTGQYIQGSSSSSFVKLSNRRN